MKKLLLLFVCVLGISSVNAQVMNTGQLLSPGKFGLSIAPCFYNDHGGISLDLNAGYGLTRSVDLNFNFNLGRGNYFGADVEWALLRGKPGLSLTTGAHIQEHVGLDFTLNLAFPIQSAIIYTGVDTDIDFNRHGDTYIPAWFFIGPEIYFRRNLSFIMELDINLTDNAAHMLALGLGIYF